MKILHIIQRAQLRGAEIFASQLATEHKKLGHTVDMVFLFGDRSKLPFSLTYIPLGGNIKKRFFDISAYRALAKFINEGKYDIVQANAGDTLKYAVFSKLLFRWNAPLVYRNANKMSEFLNSWFKLKLYGFLFRYVHDIVSVSETSRKDLLMTFSNLEAKVTTIPIGTHRFTMVEPLQFAEKEPIMINISSFVPEKNHGFLLDVFKLFVERNNKGYLWLVGDGKLRSDIEKKVQASELQSRIRFWGYTENAIAILKRSDIMVMPSKIEGLPGAILEALSCGVPVVASDAGGISEVIEDNVTGMCLNEFDKVRYVQRIEQLLFQPQLRDEIITNGRQVIEDKFLMSEIAIRFQNKYLEILNKRFSND